MSMNGQDLPFARVLTLSDGVSSVSIGFDDFSVQGLLRGEGDPFSNSLAMSLDAIANLTASC